MTRAFPWPSLAGVLAAALVARGLLLASGSVSFHSDEAIVGLMARHILNGERPVFFYGQAYMGSLDAWLVAGGFRLLGELVITIRLVQSGLYLLVVATGWLAAWRLSRRAVVASVAGLCLAVPTVNVALYTTATLGGYNETLLFGHLILLLGYDVTHDHARSAWRWGLLGLCAGLGWWTNGLIAAFALPAALLVVYRTLMTPLRQREPVRWAGILLALGAFIVGSAPWWHFDLTHNGAALATFLTNRQTGLYAGIGLPPTTPGERLLGLTVIGLPTLIGMRFPWSPAYFALPVGALAALVYSAAIFRLTRRCNPLQPDARALVLGQIGLFGALFVASSFGADPTGRYFVVLALPLGILLGTLAADLTDSLGHIVPPPAGLAFARAGTIALVLGYQAAGQIAAASAPPGFTTQFDPVSHVPNTHDAELMTFLETNDLRHGYTNYWVSFRLAFLSGERLQYSAALPYKTDLSYNPADNRYPPYIAATEAADRVAVITTNLPELDARLETDFQAQGLTYQQQRIGPFHIYFDFQPASPRISF